MKNLSRLFVILTLLPALVSAQVDTINTDKPGVLWTTDQAVPKSIVQCTRSFRERLLVDPYRPVYHFCVPEDVGRPGDPNGAFYCNGRYHLMYLYNRQGSGFSWGHISSKDLLHWRHHPDAIVPGDGDDGVFTGGAFVDQNGKAIITYWVFMNSTPVEVSGNDRQALARSVYPRFEGTRIKLFAKGGDVKVLSVKAWEVMPSNPY